MKLFSYICVIVQCVYAEVDNIIIVPKTISVPLIKQIEGISSFNFKYTLH